MDTFCIHSRQLLILANMCTQNTNQCTLSLIVMLKILSSVFEIFQKNVFK